MNIIDVVNNMELKKAKKVKLLYQVGSLVSLIIFLTFLIILIFVKGEFNYTKVLSIVTCIFFIVLNLVNFSISLKMLKEKSN